LIYNIVYISPLADGKNELAYVYGVNRKELWRMKTDGSDYRVVYTYFTRAIIAFDFDIDRKQVYLFCLTKKQIYNANANGKGGLHPVLKLGHPTNGIAIDWINRKMYWADTLNKRILVAELDGSKQAVLVDSGLGNPRAIAVDPLRG